MDQEEIPDIIHGPADCEMEYTEAMVEQEQLVKQEPLDAAWPETCVNVYDALFDVMKHEVGGDILEGTDSRIDHNSLPTGFNNKGQEVGGDRSEATDSRIDHNSLPTGFNNRGQEVGGDRSDITDSRMDHNSLPTGFNNRGQEVGGDRSEATDSRIDHNSLSTVFNNKGQEVGGDRSEATDSRIDHNSLPTGFNNRGQEVGGDRSEATDSRMDHNSLSTVFNNRGQEVGGDRSDSRIDHNSLPTGFNNRGQEVGEDRSEATDSRMDHNYSLPTGLEEQVNGDSLETTEFRIDHNSVPTGFILINIGELVGDDTSKTTDFSMVLTPVAKSKASKVSKSHKVSCGRPEATHSRLDHKCVSKDVTNFECCLTDFLLKEKTPFPKLSVENKILVLKKGRAVPDMTLSCKKRNGGTRRFTKSFYDKYAWLTGSCKLNRMFCFPCLLFSQPKIKNHETWSGTGYTDLNNFSNAVNRHARSATHIRSCVQLSEYEISRIKSSPSFSFEAHNRRVHRNRKLMKRFIDTVVLLAKRELPTHWPNGNESNHGSYIDTLLYLSEYDTILDSHLEQCSMSQSVPFSALASDVRNDLIHCLAAVTREEIKSQIKGANFVSVVIDEIDASTEQLSVALRYVSASGVEERFLGLFEVTSRSAEALSSMLLNVLDEYECKNKLIGVSFDGVAVKSEERVGAEKKIHVACPMVHFVPCYAHSLNSVLSRSLEFVSDLKVFFGHFNSICRFFNESQKRLNLMKEIADRRTPRASDIRWENHSQMFNVVFNRRTEIVETLDSIIDTPESWDDGTLAMADCLVHKLRDMKFCFLLRVVSEIFEKADAVFRSTQTEIVDTEVTKHEIDTFEKWLSGQFEDKFDSIYDSMENTCDPPRTRVFDSSVVDLKTYYKGIFMEIMDNIKSQIRYRTRSFDELSFLSLFNKSKYNSYLASFPEFEAIRLVERHFRSSLPICKDSCLCVIDLQNEFRVLYSSPSLNTLDVHGVYLQLRNSSLRDVFPHVFTLCCLYLTLPLYYASAESSFSVRKRIETFEPNAQKEGTLADSAIVSIENSLLMKMKKEPDFYAKVLAHFVKRNQRFDLEYK